MSIPTTREACWSCGNPADPGRITCRACARRLTIEHKLMGWRDLVRPAALDVVRVDQVRDPEEVAP